MKLLTYRELKVSKGIPLSQRRIDQLAAAGKFPKPIKLSPGQQGHKAWIETEIDAHLEHLAAARVE
jgi:predicted DNA-binding transcriptional regulator AlpA